MATYGIYQVLDPLYVTPTGSVHSARIVGGVDEGRIAAKVFNPPAVDPDEPNWEPKYFLDRAQVQRRVAAAPGSAHWAPVYAFGFTPEGGAYYVTDYHALTAHKMIEGRVPLDATALHAVASSVAAGLEEIQRVAGRAHANLKPTNVLLIGKGKPDELRALLCDPGQEYKAQKDGEAGDLHALGALIHELVLHRPPPSTAGPDALAASAVSPEWSRLGDKAGVWRQLCLDLLTQPIPPRAATLAAVTKIVAGLAPPRVKVPQFRLPGSGKRAAAAAAAPAAAPTGNAAQAAKKRARVARKPLGPSRVRRLLVQALAVLLLVGGGLFVFATMEASAREELCEARGSWLGSLTAALSEPQRRESYERDPHLRRVVEGVDKIRVADVPCDGGRIRPLGFLQYNRTRNAVATLRDVERDLAPENWPRLQRLRELAGTLEKRGWQQPAGFVAQLIEGVRPTPGTSTALSRPSASAVAAVTGSDPTDPARGAATARGAGAKGAAGGSTADSGGATSSDSDAPAAGASLATRIDRVLRVQPIIEEQAPAAAAEWERLDRAAGQLDRSTDPTVSGFGGMLRAHGVAAVRLTDEGFEGLPDLDQHARLAAQVLAELAKDAKRPVDVARFDAEVVQKFIQPNDLEPGDVKVWLDQRRLYAVRTQDRDREAKRLDAEFHKVAETVAASAPDEAEREAFAQAQRDLETNIRDFGRTGFIDADMVADGRFGEKVKEIEGQIGNLKRYYHAEDPADWLKNLAGVETTSGAIKRKWAGWVDTLRDEASFMVEHRDRFAENKKRTVDLRNVLDLIDLQLPQPPDTLSEGFKPYAARRREERIAELLKQVNSATPAMDPDVLSAARDSLAKWFDEFAALNATFPIRGTRLLTLDDRPDVEWEARNPSFWSDPLVQTVVGPDLDRIRRLQGLRTAGRETLVAEATAEGVRPEVTVAAWRLLGESPALRPAWPDTAKELEVEATLRQRVRAAIRSLGDFEREEMAQLLANEGPRRWRRFVEGITPQTADQKLAVAYEQRRVFGMTKERLAELDPASRFNFCLYVAKNSIGVVHDEDLRKAIENLVDSAGDLKDPQQARGRAVAEKLKKLRVDEPFAGQQMGETYSLAAPGLAEPILFRRVEASGDSGRAFYLAASEVTLGQFVGALRGSPKHWQEALRLDWPLQPGKPDGRRGPRAWEWAGQADPTLSAPLLWMTDHRDGRNNDFPPDFREHRLNRNVIGEQLGGMPSERHPMQYVTPQAALFYAAALGCRLPTTAEWQAAVAAGGQTPPNGRNLRDAASWETFRAYAGKEKIPANRWPDDGAFPDDPRRKPDEAPPPGRRGNDGVLLFRPAPEGGEAFHDLVGNVAEYVCEAPEKFEGWKGKATAEGVKEFLRDAPESLAVIGGSALSAPDVPLDKPVPVRQTHRAYSDVGLRLAFTAPARNLAERLKWVLAGEEYLAPSRTVSASTDGDAR